MLFLVFKIFMFFNVSNVPIKEIFGLFCVFFFYFVLCPRVYVRLMFLRLFVLLLFKCEIPLAHLVDLVN